MGGTSRRLVGYQKITGCNDNDGPCRDCVEEENGSLGRIGPCPSKGESARKQRPSHRSATNRKKSWTGGIRLGGGGQMGWETKKRVGFFIRRGFQDSTCEEKGDGDASGSMRTSSSNPRRIRVEG